MAGRRTYARAFPIKESEARGYRMSRGARYRKNGMGVTTLAAVNGRGAYAKHKSLRDATRGLSKQERLARARRQLNNNRSRSMSAVHRARFVRRTKSTAPRRMASNRARARAGTKHRMSPNRARTSASAKRRGKWLAAYRAAQLSGKSAESARRSANRKVKLGGSTRGKRRAYRRNGEGPAQVATTKYRSGYDRTFKKKPKRRKTKAKATKRRAAPKRRKATKRAKPKQFAKVRTRRGTRRVRVAYGRYKRLRATDPKTGRTRRTVLYRAKRAKRRKIPLWAIAGARSSKEFRTSERFEKARARIARRRRSAAARLERSGDAFTPNGESMAKRKTKTKGKRRAKRSKKKSTGRKTRRTARRSTKRKKTRKSGKRRAAKKTRRKSGKRKSTRRSTRRTTKKSRRKSSSRRGARKGTKRRGGKRRAPRRITRIGRRKVSRLRRGALYQANPRRRRRKSRKSYSRNRRRMTSNRRRSHRRNYRRNGFMGDIGSLLKHGTLALAGFFSHKAITGALVSALTKTDTAGAVTFVGQPLLDTAGAPTVFATWQKPMVGALIGFVELAILAKVPSSSMANDTKMAVGGGVVLSFLQSIVHSALTQFGQPKALSYLEGYQNSAAYALRGARGRRRGMRGLGVARNATSIMPRYTPVSGMGQYRQAAAGMGEYFAAQSGVGEYFASAGVQGVGHYENAGPLALQPSRRLGQIDDGIRPDSDLDHVMDLSESAAGVGQFRQAAAGMGQGYTQAAAGMGEYWTAQRNNGGFVDHTVPTQDQTIPNGPMWAGTMGAGAAYTESELPAGILQTPGGNGVLSG